MRGFIVSIAAVLLLTLAHGGAAYGAEEAWPGVDETVVGRYAEANGHPACAPLLDLEGDALLFAFLMAGAAGGFVMGYSYRGFASGGKGGGGAG